MSSEIIIVESSAPKLDLNKEADRLLSFEDWPVAFIDINMMARAGFYYKKCSHSMDKVRCHFCRRYYAAWVAGTCPISRHVQTSPNCPLFSGKSTNIPLNKSEMDSLLCTAKALRTLDRYANIAVRPSQSDLRTRFNSLVPLTSIDETLVRSLAENGFFYDWGVKKILCFCCGMTYKHDHDMTVGENHITNSCACEFVNVEYGQRRINKAVRRRLLKEIKTPAPSSNGIVDQEHMVKAECVICYNGRSEYIARPCGHLLYCNECKSANVINCPICKMRVICTQRIFFP